MEKERFPHPLRPKSQKRNHRKTKESELPAAVLQRQCFCCWSCFPSKKIRHISFWENVPYFFYSHSPISPMICCICARSPSGRF